MQQRMLTTAVAIAKEVGFLISADELHRAQAVGEELSDEELGAVAGGATTGGTKGCYYGGGHQ